MNYRRIFRNQSTRIFILGLLDFIPDRLMVKIQYYISQGRRLNLKNPQRFTEKLQWYKLNYRDKEMSICADKFTVRKYIKDKGLEDILVPLHGVYDEANQINFDELPNKFVLKVTNGSHTNIVCTDKKSLNLGKTITQLNEWLTKRSSKLGREWAYYGVKPKIICEKFLEDNFYNDLIDYKFFCFNGEIQYIYVIGERSSTEGVKLAIYDKNFNKTEFLRNDIPPLLIEIKKPDNFDEMMKISEILAKDFPHVRVDLYNVNGKIYFGELTFYDGSGYKGFIPDSFDFEMGKEWEIKI